jgi:hypothetical protein
MIVIVDAGNAAPPAAAVVAVEERLEHARRERQRHPSTLAERVFDRVDHFLHPGAVPKSPRWPRRRSGFADEAADQVGVEEVRHDSCRPPPGG